MENLDIIADDPLPDEVPLDAGEPEETDPADAGETDAPKDPESEEDDGEDGPDDDTPKSRKRPGKYQRTVQRLEQQNYALAQQLQALTDHVQGRGAARPAQPPVPADQPPKPEQFQSYEDYVVAKAEWKVEQKFRTAQAAQIRAAQQAQQAEVLGTFNGRLENGRSTYADFDEVVFNPAVDISTAMVEALVDCEHGADVAYWLGKNPKEASRIAGLSRAAQAREIGKIEAKLSSRSVRTTNAPPPVRTVTGGGSARRDPASMSMDEYRRWRMGESK